MFELFFDFYPFFFSLNLLFVIIKLYSKPREHDFDYILDNLDKLYFYRLTWIFCFTLKNIKTFYVDI